MKASRRLYENQLGRSRRLHRLALRPDARQLFGDLGVADAADAFSRRPSTGSHPGYIRTEADEVHYNLHILLRFDLERASHLRRDLAVRRPARGLGRPLRRRFRRPRRSGRAHGVLQDVHWSVGLFGYFPTYALGNVYAGCLHKAALRADLPDLDAASRRRRHPAPATAWLRGTGCSAHGGLLSTPARRSNARCRRLRAVTAAPLLDYLDAKFTALYDLGG
jgi:carboxypeptidase Taq